MFRAQAIRCFAYISLLTIVAPGCDRSLESDPFDIIITSAAPLEATVDQEYTYSVTATGYPQPTFSLEEAPEGMTIDEETGQISWLPSSDAAFNSAVVVSAANSRLSVSQGFVIQVKGLQIEGWETGSLVSASIDPDEIWAVADDIKDGAYHGIKSSLIIRNGRLVFEEYYNGASRNTALNIYSAEKSITSCLMGIAIDSGLIADAYEPLYEFFPEYDTFSNWSSGKEYMKLVHLITMTSGFELEGTNYDLWLNNIGPRDWIKFYLDLPLTFYPGTAMDYKSLCDRLAGHVIERQAQIPLPEFAADHLFNPLGMAYYNWDGWNPVDNSMISGQLRLRAVDMAKVGQMYLDGGVWNGNRIVSEEWVTRSTTIYRRNYGYNWWVRTWETPVGEIDVYYAAGNGGNTIFVFSELQMIVVFTGDYFVQPDVWDQQWDILKQRIIPAVDRDSQTRNNFSSGLSAHGLCSTD